MEKLNIVSASTREQYDLVRSCVNELIKEATKLGMLEPRMDNEYLSEIARLAKISAEYEDEYMNVLPLREIEY
ncbi:MAG: hypothetical protein KBE55_08050 [Bacteroides sp.]|uniref:hypothetical protein n=1 Tax=Bacteroides sp. TaxID=29523 RepID=UPI001B5B3A04|nr:hypothetical protein [Bacteroides sp.]MBP9586830.1 hypothetical protein [Bacteroides sp.]